MDIRDTLGNYQKENKIKANFYQYGYGRNKLADKIDYLTYNWYLTEQQAIELLKKWNLA